MGPSAAETSFVDAPKPASLVCNATYVNPAHRPTDKTITTGQSMDANLLRRDVFGVGLLIKHLQKAIFERVGHLK